VSWFARRSDRDTRDALTPLQIRWLGALLIAAQIPQSVHLPIWVAVTGLLLVAVRIVLLARDPLRPEAPPARIPSWALALFAVAAAFAVRYSFHYFVGRDPSVAFLYILVAIKYLETRTRRDGTLLVCLACFLSMTPFFYNQSVFAALAAVPVVLLVGVALDVLASAGSESSRPFTPRVAIRRSAVMMLQGLPIAILLFVIFPRLAQPLWGLPTDYAAKSGLSDSMSPGEISELSLSDNVAFRVEFDGPPPPPRDRYWRGPVFSRFDGVKWSPSFAAEDGSGAPAAGGRAISYTVTLEPTDRRSLFALEQPASLPRLGLGSGEAPGFQPRITRDRQLIAAAAVSQTIQYQQRSILRASYPVQSAYDARANLGLGKGNPRTVELGRELRERYPDDATLIRAVLAKFHDEEYVYTFSPGLAERDATDVFLFEARRGFCEHYASAFVLLLRAAGIPARVVTGYQGGTVNPRGGYMIVRQSDAHAWAEALVDGEWRRFDPTAAVSPSRIEIGLGAAFAKDERLPFLARLDATWMTNVRLAWDAFNYGWRRNFVGFNRDRQQSMFREWKVDQFALWEAIALIMLLVAAWAGGVIVWLMWKRRHQERALVLWDDLNRRLALAGLPRHPYEGPLAFSSRAAARWPQFAIAFSAIGESFAELRYGAIAVAREREALVATLSRAIEVLPAPRALRATT
jgi:transglutaminase-like putative cysteine protease